MQRFGQKRMVVGIVTLLGIFLLAPVMAFAQDQSAVGQIPEGVYIKLTRDLYDAFKNETAGNTKVYSNDPSKEYLRQIAISSRFVVETNFEILKQQERMIQLLDALLKNKR